MNTINDRIKSFFTYANGKVLEKPEVFRLGLVAVAARDNMEMIGLHGVAKSACTRIIANATGLTYWEGLASKFSVPSEFVGPVDIPAMNAGRARHVTEGMMPSAQVVNIEELWRGSSALHSAILPMTNPSERLFHNGDEVVRTPIRTVFASSNSEPASEELAAASDRFTIKLEVKPTEEPTNQSRILWDDGLDSGSFVFDPGDVELIEKAADNVTVSPDAKQATEEILRSLIGKVYVSDRRRRRIKKFLQTCAVVDGRDTVEQSDLCDLRHVLWSKRTERPAIEELIDKLVASWVRDIRKLNEIVAAIDAEWKAAPKGDIRERLKTLQDVHEKAKDANESATKLLATHPGRLDVQACATRTAKFLSQIEMVINS